MSNKENDLVEMYGVERMTFHALEEHSKVADQDCKKLVIEGNSKILQLTNEKNYLCMKKYDREKESDLNEVAK